MTFSRRIAAAVLAAALALPAGAVLPVAALAQEDVNAFREASPSCDANPTLPWIGRVSGESDEDPTDNTEPVSFVGCFATKAECDAWRERGSGLIDDRIVENVCEQRQ
jgi:hypothetical protein